MQCGMLKDLKLTTSKRIVVGVPLMDLIRGNCLVRWG